MADKKISQLTAATTPLAGTEVVPVVQSGVTKKVPVADLTAGRDVAVKTITADNVKTSAAAANLDISGNTIAAAGSGTNVDVNINAKGAGIAYLNQKWGVNASGTLVPASANTYDIGNGTNNPRDVNVDRYLNVKGVILAGVSTGSHHTIVKSSGGEVDIAVEIGSYNLHNTLFTGGYGYYYNAANACIKVPSASASTNRSINASGTINASGADYAEYEYNDGLVIEKGSIVGFKQNGALTLTFDEAIRFGVKSTNPSYVGGDAWGTEDIVGVKKPVKPMKDENESDEEWQTKLNEYEQQKANFEAAYEAVRKTVDRIAYSGKVPVNVINAIAGGYIIADKDANGNIVGKYVDDVTFEEYKLCVGRVNKILPDGRAEIAVIVH